MNRTNRVHHTMGKALAFALVPLLFVCEAPAQDLNPTPLTDSVQSASLAFAFAGKDTLIYKNQTRPDTVVLDGRASTGASAYQWLQLSGPSVSLIASPSSALTNITGLKEGTYRFQLTVNGTAKDTVVVTVRDWQKKNVTPCRPGGGKAFIVSANKQGRYDYQYINRDKIVGEQVMGGDTLYFKGGTYPAFEIGDFGGDFGCPVYIMAKDEPVIVKNGYFRVGIRDSNLVQHAILDGTTLRSKGIPYGFILDNSSLPLGTSNMSNLVAGWVTHFTLKGYRSYNTGILQIKLDAREQPFGRYDKFIENRIVLTDNFINYSTGEGLYIGHTAPDGGQNGNPYGPPPRMDSVEITNNIVMNTSWDGIQLANARSGNIIKNNIVYRSGLANQSSQKAGILLGGNASGNIDSNLVVNATGNAIQVFGFGASNVRGNIVDSIYSGAGNQDGFYESYLTTAPETNVPLSVNNTGNLISRAERYSILVANNAKNMLSGSDNSNYLIHPTETVVSKLIIDNSKGWISNNTIAKNFRFNVNAVDITPSGPSISMTQGDATKSFTNAKDIIDWLFLRLKSPVAIAGKDTSITLPMDSIQLTGDGSVSYGTITSYQWRSILVPANYSALSSSQQQLSLSHLVEGLYGFEFAVTVDQSATARDTMYLTVKPAPNQLPVANAGADKWITLPSNNVLLSGSGTDADGTISKYSWSKVSGPSSFTISNSSSAVTSVSGLVAGEYTFALTVTDNRGDSTTDSMNVVVNIPPVAHAGNDTTIEQPIDSVRLYGIGTDADGAVSKFAWKKLAGPAGDSIVNAFSAITLVKGLVEGIYTYELAVTDNDGATVRDSIKVTVKAYVDPSSSSTGTVVPDTTKTVKSIKVNIYGIGTPYNNSEWNNWNLKTTVVTNANSGVLKYSDGMVSNVSAIISRSYNTNDNYDGYGSGMAPAEVLRYDSYDIAPRLLTITGLNTSRTYTIELYASRRTTGNSTIFKIGTVSDTINTYNNLTRKAAFNFVKPNAQGQIIVSISNLNQYNYLNGFTIFENDSTMIAGPLLQSTAQTLAVSAGADRMIVLPKDTVVLEGVTEDPYQVAARYKWTKLAGPAALMDQSSPRELRLRDLAEGVYKFRFDAFDVFNNVVSDTVRVMVKSPVRSTASVYPNPAKDVINLKIDAATHMNQTTLSVYDRAGILVYKETFMRSENTMTKQINISSWRSGVYWIRVNTDINDQQTIRVMKL